MRQKFLATVIALLAASCSSPSPDESNSKTVDQNTGVAAQIDRGVFAPYTRDQFPKAFKSWGEEGIKRIQKLRENAARTVASNPKCDAVEISDLSENRSNIPTNSVVFVDCRNGERFYLSEADIGSAPSSEQELGARFSRQELVERCTEEVKSKLNLPSTFDQALFSVSDRQGVGTGNRVIEFDFSAKNAFGIELPASARCIMTTQGVFEVSVTER